MNFKDFLYKIHSKKYFSLIFIIIFTFILAAATNYILQYSETTARTMLWIKQNTGNFFMGTAFIFFIYIFIISLIGRFYIGSELCFIFFAILAFANIKKLSMLGEPVYPVDLYQIRYIKDLYQMIGGHISLFLIAGVILFIAAVVYLTNKLPKLSLNIPSRIFILFLSTFMIYSYTNYKNTFVKEYLDKVGITEVMWDQHYNYGINGFVFGVLSNLQTEVMEKPAEYTKENVIKIAQKYKNKSENINKTRTENADKIEPNIIFIMDEAFWDPTRLSSIKFSEDPIKNIRKIMSNESSGWLLSPTFGGGTANTEFEALTGLSMYNVITGSIPYQQAIDKKKFVPSIVSILGDNGYDTLAVHAYGKTFYKRDRVYKTLGFNNFVSENEMQYTNKKTEDAYISDQAVVNEIMKQLKERTNPAFMHVVTMQNHAPQKPEKNIENTISISGLNKEDTIQLESYAQSIKYSDEAVKNLIDNLSKYHKPTMVVFFGDHLPSLNDSIYEKGNFGKGENTLLNERQLSETPLFIYSNFDLNKEKLKTLSPSFLGVTIFDMLNKPLTPYYAMLEDLKSHFPGLKSTVMVDLKGDIKTSLTGDEKQLLEDYKLIQYDLMMGNQYSLSILFDNQN